MERLISLSLARRSIEYARRAAWRRTVFAKFLSHLGARIDPKSQDVSMREESSCLVKRESYPISCGGGAGLFRARRGREAGWDCKHLPQIIQQKFCHACMVAASTM